MRIAPYIAAFCLSASASALAQPRDIPHPIYGLTLDAVDHLPDIIDSLQSLSHKPTTRIVFDEGVNPGSYVSAIQRIYPVSFIMGEILDSEYVKTYTVAAYSQRTANYLNAFSQNVDLWEVGNEVNGEWLGTSGDVSAKIYDAWKQAHAAHLKTAVTLYYNGPADDGSHSCWAKKDHEMFSWAQANIPADMKQGLDYVLVSYYEDDCNGIQPDWNSVFAQLAQMFPYSYVGFGENGTSKKAKKAAYIQRYYGMNVPVSTYIGGHFWWYGKQDFVPKSKPLWSTFNSAIGAN